MDIKNKKSYAYYRTVDCIYSLTTANGNSVSKDNVKNVIHNELLSEIRARQVISILNANRAWALMVEELGKSLTIEFLLKINYDFTNSEMLSSGLRTVDVELCDCYYQPEIPVEEKVVADLNTILTSSMPDAENAFRVMFYIILNHLFAIDNEETAHIVANKLLLEKCDSVFIIPDDLNEIFGELIDEFYKTGNDTELIEFLINKCVVPYNGENLDGFEIAPGFAI
jgi:hypothetical protein